VTVCFGVGQKTLTVTGLSGKNLLHGKDGCIAQLDFQPNRWTFCKCRGFTVEEPCADAQPEGEDE